LHVKTLLGMTLDLCHGTLGSRSETLGLQRPKPCPHVPITSGLLSRWQPLHVETSTIVWVMSKSFKRPSFRWERHRRLGLGPPKCLQRKIHFSSWHNPFIFILPPGWGLNIHQMGFEPSWRFEIVISPCTCSLGKTSDKSSTTMGLELFRVRRAGSHPRLYVVAESWYQRMSQTAVEWGIWKYDYLVDGCKGVYPLLLF